MGFCNKTGFYPSRLEARLAAARISARTGDKMRAYFCEYHMCWHLTTGRKPGYAKKYRTAKSVSDRKKYLLERAEKSDSRQLRHLREWEDD